MPLPIVFVASFFISVKPEITFWLLTVSVFSFSYIFSNTEDWELRSWLAAITGALIMGCTSVYLTLEVVLQYS